MTSLPERLPSEKTAFGILTLKIPFRLFSCCPFLLTLVIASTADGLQELPGENQLPSRKLPQRSLPDESHLAGSYSGDEGQPSSDPVSRELPPESELPPTSAGEHAPPTAVAAEGESLQLDGQRPWLRLDAGGPTAPQYCVRFTADSRQLVSGGDDKELHVWRLVDRDAETEWIYQGRLPWQVQRGTRGAIRAIAATPDAIAFGGIGASDLIGEIALYNSADIRFSRTLFDSASGHRRQIAGMAADGAGRLVSLDGEGRVLLWERNAETGQWSPTTLRPDDTGKLGATAAERLIEWRLRAGAIAASESGDVVYAELAGAFQATRENPWPQWKLIRRNMQSGEETDLSVVDAASRRTLFHAAAVTSIGVSGDGKRIVSADLTDAGRVFIWDLARNQAGTTFAVNAPVRSVSVSPSGRLLLIATARRESGTARILLWRWDENGKFETLGSWNSAEHVMSACISPDENWVAYTAGNQIVVRSLSELDAEPVELASGAMIPGDVAFAAVGDDYQFRISDGTGGESQKKVFEPKRLRLTNARAEGGEEWIAANPFPQRWKVVTEKDALQGTEQWYAEIDGARRCRIPLDINLDGQITCSSWIARTDRPDLPAAIVVGTNKRHQLYVFRIVDSGDCPLVRQFRGHEASVNSVGVSRDHRLLVSSSLDGTARVWKLDGALDKKPADELLNRWGARFRVDDRRLVVEDVIDDGPLYFRGVRSGDVIDKLDWTNPLGDAKSSSEPEEMLTALESDDWRRLVWFRYSRRGAEQPEFVLYGAWQPVASLVATRDQEWAWWTPYGYYDASFNGHKLFGWQINRGIENPPDYFRAAEMKNELERPELMEKLLSASGIEEAFRQARLNTPSNLTDRLAAETRLRPRIELLEPAPASVMNDRTATIRARIEVADGVDLVPPRAFANGVPAGRAKLESTREENGKTSRVYSWQAALPGEREIRIHVLASTEFGSGDAAHVDVRQEEIDPSPNPRLFLIAAGVNQYADRGIPRLDYAVNNATVITRTLAGSGKSLYAPDSSLLANQNVNRPLWSVATRTMLERLRIDAGPDDLLVFFLSGHGVRDPRSHEYYYVTAAARQMDLQARRYADCISLEDFAMFADVPCRKLVILDTCHSGAVQPLRQSDLKAVVRALENDFFFTLTASEGNEPAFESSEERLGYFTASLVEALGGLADERAHGGNSDGRVDLAEAVRYVRATVPMRMSGVGLRQYPTASPNELLPFARIPLTTASGPHD